MNVIEWQGRWLAVRRLVLSRGSGVERRLYSPVACAAEQLGIAVAVGIDVAPQAGDIWVGGLPQSGWGSLGPWDTAWVAPFEIPELLDALHQRQPTCSKSTGNLAYEPTRMFVPGVDDAEVRRPRFFAEPDTVPVGYERADAEYAALAHG